MAKDQRVQACLEELGFIGTPKESSIRTLLEQIYDHQPSSPLDEQFSRTLLTQLQYRQRRQAQGVTGWIKRRQGAMIVAPLLVLLVVGIRSPRSTQTPTPPTHTRQAQPMMRSISQPPIEKTITAHDAIVLLTSTYEDLAVYLDQNTLPPKSIRTQSDATGWLVAFILAGSGRSAILGVECYHVAHTRDITHIISLGPGDTELYDDFDMRVCQ